MDQAVNHKTAGGPLATLFVDMNSYFASVEQQEQPGLRGRPVAVVPVVTDTTCCIAASYEAKHHGVKTGTGITIRRGRPRSAAITPMRSR